MSTVYSGEVAVGSWNRIRIKCDYSGTSASLTIQFRRTSAYSTTWSSTSATLTFNGQTKSAAYSYTGTVGTNWVDLRSAISGYTISTSGGTYNWSFVDNAVLGCSGTITIPSQGSAPSNGRIENLAVQYNGTELEFSSTNVSVSDGGLALNLRRFEICEVPLTGSGISAQIKNFTIGQPITLTQSDSTAHDGGITIVGNHLYYSGLCARNSVGTYYYDGPSIVTPCEPATFSLEPIDSHSISVSYATVADGGYYSKTLEYSLDGESWNTGATVLSGAASSGTFTISSLDSYKDYTIQFRVTTPAGSTDSGSISFALFKPKFYGSTFSVINVTGTIPEDIQVASVGWTTFSAALSGIISSGITLDNLPVSANLKRYNAVGWTMEITLADDTMIRDRTPQSGDIDPRSPFVAKWGITIDQSHLGTSGAMPLTVLSTGGATKINELYGSLSNQTKSIVKLYASENGRAKLIYKEK